MSIKSWVILPLDRSFLKTLCRKIVSSLFISRGGARRDRPAVKTAVRHQEMAVRIEPEEVAKGLYETDPKKELQGFAGATAQIGKEIRLTEEISSQDPKKFTKLESFCDNVVNSRRRDLRPHRTLEFSCGAFTPQEAKGRYTPPGNPSTRFPQASWGVYLTIINQTSGFMLSGRAR